MFKFPGWMESNQDRLKSEYLYEVVKTLGKEVSGSICEVGVRLGGSGEVIVNGLLDSDNMKQRVYIAVDPYGNIKYAPNDKTTCCMNYTNKMRADFVNKAYSYYLDKNVDFVFINLEDMEFFERYNTGVPFYNGFKSLITKYAFVFVDGPHDTKSVKLAVDFFRTRIPTGGIIIFDDLQCYDHDSVEKDLLEDFEIITMALEISDKAIRGYRKI